ncbi:hypothetical protein MNO14_16445 [Luteimonas sp. S4-F44]|uniref:DUF7079 family protein n=1 Tax=Luteimonas sp. S4-F44 TaxID=2925842 RepID=UPI001F535FDA|nr:hypothetical protein [Luteimonas sp. S4-F44]UNK42494.1 hypothetical protein MNO14_16445 [Luteimonas sp. S4-F44]
MALSNTAPVEPKRLQLWQALSDLFLDTEIDDTTIVAIARVVRETGYTAAEVHRVLWGEVYPVLAPNLRSVAGIWSGWPDAWLAAHLRVHVGPAPRPRGRIAATIARDWARVAAHLPPGFA